MATSKSTVVGIRLDHERRAWVEAEAARLGVSVRGLFEGMIDEARLGPAEAAEAIATLGSAAPVQAAADPLADATSEESINSEQLAGANAAQSSASEASGSSPWPGVGSVTSVPGGLIREAFSLTASLIELGGRCATKGLSSCALTRRWSQPSL